MEYEYPRFPPLQPITQGTINLFEGWIADRQNSQLFLIFLTSENLPHCEPFRDAVVEPLRTFVVHNGFIPSVIFLEVRTDNIELAYLGLNLELQTPSIIAVMGGARDLRDPHTRKEFSGDCLGGIKDLINAWMSTPGLWGRSLPSP